MRRNRTILVIEDEVAIAEAVVDRLRSAGYEAEACFDGASGVARWRELGPDLVILDLLLPGLSGLEVCRQIQLERRTPVLMLSALDDETDVLVGLGLGADDYVTKPFSPRELVARVEAVLRRVGESVARDDDPKLRHRDLEVDVETRIVERNGVEVSLTPTEFALLVALLRRDGAVLTRAELLNEVWNYNGDAGVRTVDSHIRGLRRKLGADIVRTVHGVGYARTREA